VTGALPWIPKVKFYNPFLTYENGDDFDRPFRGASGESKRPSFWLSKGRFPRRETRLGILASFGTDPASGQPSTTCDWIDRLVPNAWAIIATGTCATYGGIQPMEGNPTGCMGLPDYLGWEMEIERDYSEWDCTS